MVDALGPPPDPAKLLGCIPGLLEKVNAILKLLPPVSIPFMAKALINALIVYLEGLKQDLRSAILAAARAARTALRAAELNNFRLQATADCVEGSFDIQLVNLNESAKPLSRLILVLNVFLGLAEGTPASNSGLRCCRSSFVMAMLLMKSSVGTSIPPVNSFLASSPTR